MPLKPGDSLANGQYHVIRLLGRGGFGFVYLARDTVLQEDVAIKELIPALAGDEEMLKRFLGKAKATIRLTHKRIVRTYNVFVEGGNYYIAMEYMPGGTLEQRLRDKGQLAADEAVPIAVDVCEGLACAHEDGVVHCDLKPANILFAADGRAKVADFGIAHIPREMFTRSWATAAGFTAGTLPYMAPEQAGGVRDKPRVDVYALGAVLYRMLTGRTYLEFDGSDTPRAQANNLRLIDEASPAPPSRRNRAVPAWLDQVVLRALAKRPEERYAGAADMRDALLRRGEAAVAGGPAPTIPFRRARPTPRRYWRWAAAAMGALAVGVAVMVGAGIVARATPTPTRTATPALGAPASLPASAPSPAQPPASALSPPAPSRAAPAPTSTPPPTAAPAAARSATPPAAPPNVPSPAKGAAQVGAGSTATSPADGMVMVYVPAGEFLMGSADDDPDAGDNEKPQRKVYLDAFWIDRSEVTNAMYARCVAAGACQVPGQTTSYTRNGYYEDAQFGDYPVLYVSWADAGAYCRWAQRRLPTEAQWEKAARGTDGRSYPWGGQAPDVNRASYEAHAGDTTRAGSYSPRGDSPYGAWDMAGNAWEWVADWYDAGYYQGAPGRNPAGPEVGERKVLRGGSWDDNDNSLRAAYRYYYDPARQDNDAGFRCAAVPGG